MTSPVLETALRLAARGLRVAFGHRPIGDKCTCGKFHDDPKSIGKHPIGGAWQRAASSDEQTLRDKFQALDHECNLGVVLGPCDAGYLIAIDIDDEETFTELAAKHGALPPTLTGHSPRGARLFFSVAPIDGKEIRNGHITHGVDVKARNGYVVVGPSLHPSGGSYSWDDLAAPIAELPIAWLQAILPPPKAEPVAYVASAPNTKEVNRVRKWAQAIARREAERVSRAPEGQRNAVLYSAACRTLPAVFEAGLSSFDARAELTAGAKAAGLGEKEIHLTLQSAEDWVLKNDVRRKPPEPQDRPALYAVSGNAAVAVDRANEADKLIYDRGQPAKIAANVVTLLKGYPRGTPRYNEFTDRVTWSADDKPVKETDAIDVQRFLYEKDDALRVRVSLETIQAAINRYAEDHVYHPVREYLRKLKWDLEPRCERLFTRAFGALNTPYVRAASRCWMIAAVARVMRPGCKVDTMPILEGIPGLGKSTAIRTLASDAWFSDTPIAFGDKDAYQALVGVWIYEHAELTNWRGREAERVKAYLSSSTDHYRKSYGRSTEDVKRQSVFVGSTNNTDYSSDETGGIDRRIWPVPCTKIDSSIIDDYRDQLWAEAVALYDARTPWWLVGDDILSEHATMVADRRPIDAWSEFVAKLEPREHTSGEVLGLIGVDPERRDYIAIKRVARVLKDAGWMPHQTSRNGAKIRLWLPPDR